MPNVSRASIDSARMLASRQGGMRIKKEAAVATKKTAANPNKGMVSNGSCPRRNRYGPSQNKASKMKKINDGGATVVALLSSINSGKLVSGNKNTAPTQRMSSRTFAIDDLLKKGGKRPGERFIGFSRLVYRPNLIHSFASRSTSIPLARVNRNSYNANHET